MLRALSGVRHTVLTGLCLLGPPRPPLWIARQPMSSSATLSDREIDDYTRSGESMDKARWVPPFKA